MDRAITLYADESGLAGVRQLEDLCEEAMNGWNAAFPPFLFAVREALLNALEVNALYQAGDKVLEATIRYDGKWLVAEVPDFGPGLPQDWKKKQLSCGMESLLENDRGRGLLFMNELCDEVDSTRDKLGRHTIILKVRTGNDG